MTPFSYTPPDSSQLIESLLPSTSILLAMVTGNERQFIVGNGQSGFMIPLVVARREESLDRLIRDS